MFWKILREGCGLLNIFVGLQYFCDDLIDLLSLSDSVSDSILVGRVGTDFGRMRCALNGVDNFSPFIIKSVMLRNGMN
jgi:hypothetical protein